MGLRNSFGLPWLASGANATPWLEKPRNTALTEFEQNNPASLHSPLFLHQWYLYVLLSAKHRMHIALQQAGRQSGPSPYYLPLMRLRSVIRQARMQQLQAGLCLSKQVSDPSGVLETEILGWTIPSHVTQLVTNVKVGRFHDGPSIRLGATSCNAAHRATTAGQHHHCVVNL